MVDGPLEGYVSTNATKTSKISKLGNLVKTSLFMEALRNLNWSRDYLWYVELDGVPTPFHRGGVLGLPCTNIQYTLSTGSTYKIPSFMQDLVVPHRTGEFPSIQLTMLDDEQGTLRMFFERWWNEIYNPYLGVLPLTEACKGLTIYTQKTTRTNIKRVYYDIDQKLFANSSQTASSIIKNGIKSAFSNLLGWGESKQETAGIDYAVFPSDDFTVRLNSDGGGGIVTITVNLQVAQFLNQDFGNPGQHTGILSIAGFDGPITDGTSFLDKIADYI